jgi:DNA ligase 1
VLLSELVEASAAVTATSARNAKIERIAALLVRVEPAEVPVAVAFLSGELLQRQIGVGYAAIGGVFARAAATVEVVPAQEIASDEKEVAAAAADAAGNAAGGPAAPALTLTDVTAAFTAIGLVTGPGSQAERRRLLTGLFAGATDPEREFLVRLLAGDLRQGALEGVMTDAVARAAGVPAEEVRRAHQLGGSLPEVAGAALAGGPGTGPAGDAGSRATDQALAALRGFTLRVGRPARPMLAASAPDVATAFGRMSGRVDRALDKGAVVMKGEGEGGMGRWVGGGGSQGGGGANSGAIRDDDNAARCRLGTASPAVLSARPLPTAAAEWKIDGIRIQVHRAGHEIAVFTRTLDDITARVPEIVEAARSLPVTSAVLDGEAVALAPDGTPRPFQVTAARTASQADVGRLRAQTPLTTFLFDLLHLDGTDLIDAPASERHRQLSRIAPGAMLTPRIVTGDLAAAEAFFADAVAHGHEGIVVKSLDAPYRAGRRGGDWIKVKPRHTLDLVILAAEWGHGRRRGVLSNLHLGARDPETGSMIMLGKTFKGLTDEMLAWQTGKLLELAEPAAQAPAEADRRRAHGVVWVRPELVVEIAFDGVQASSRYPGGLALRFARVLRYRPDKKAADADTIDAVRAIWSGRA